MGTPKLMMVSLPPTPMPPPNSKRTRGGTRKADEAFEVEMRKYFQTHLKPLGWTEKTGEIGIVTYTRPSAPAVKKFGVDTCKGERSLAKLVEYWREHNLVNDDDETEDNDDVLSKFTTSSRKNDPRCDREIRLREVDYFFSQQLITVSERKTKVLKILNEV